MSSFCDMDIQACNSKVNPTHVAILPRNSIHDKMRCFLAFSGIWVWAGKPVSPCQKLETLSMADKKEFLSARGLDKGGHFFFLWFPLSGLIGGLLHYSQRKCHLPTQESHRKGRMGLGVYWASEERTHSIVACICCPANSRGTCLWQIAFFF